MRRLQFLPFLLGVSCALLAQRGYAPTPGAGIPPGQAATADPEWQSIPSATDVFRKPLQTLTADGKAIPVHVTVTDSQGRPVAGLGQADFTVLDDKIATPIVGFQGPVTAGAAEGMLYILIDGVNQPYQRMEYTRQQTSQFLKRAGTTELPISVEYITDTGLQHLAGPSNDGAQLAQQLDHSPTSLRTLGRNTGVYGAEERTGISLHALEALASDAARSGGRKALIWVSPGWPMLDTPNQVYSGSDERKMYSAIATLTTLLQRANITLYNVNSLDAGQSAELYPNIYKDFLKPVTKPGSIYLSNLALPVFAVHSGGIVTSPTNDLAAGVAESAADAVNAYTVFIQPKPGQERPVYHALQVTVNHPGAKVRATAGYYALQQ